MDEKIFGEEAIENYAKTFPLKRAHKSNYFLRKTSLLKQQKENQRKT